MNKSEGGLGVPNIEWIYTATRISHLLRMLNNDDPTVRTMALIAAGANARSPLPLMENQGPGLQKEIQWEAGHQAQDLECAQIGLI